LLSTPLNYKGREGVIMLTPLDQFMLDSGEEPLTDDFIADGGDREDAFYDMLDEELVEAREALL